MIWGNGVPASSGEQLRSTRGFSRPAATREVERLHEPVEELLDDDGGNVKEAVDAARTAHDQREVGHPVQGLVRVEGLLGGDQVPEADRRKSHEAEVQAVQVCPPFHRAVQKGSARRNQDGRQE